ncbi:MAG: M50 family metallopeptidase [Frankia sp.]|nr:M50 family metallopeptidase [Frankia sp.]
MLFHLADPSALLGILLALVIGIYAHDTAQILAARLIHDPTPRMRMKAGLIPRRVGPFSAVSMLIVGNGWAEPVPMNDIWRSRRFKISAALLAGPFAYLLLSLGAVAGAWAVTEPLDPAFMAGSSHGLEVEGPFLASMLGSMAATFASMFILSLIPVPPTDGGRILFLLAPRTPGWQKAQYQLTERNLGVVLLLVILLLPVLLPLPSVTGQLWPPLVDGLVDIFGSGLFIVR